MRLLADQRPSIPAHANCRFAVPIEDFHERRRSSSLDVILLINTAHRLVEATDVACRRTQMPRIPSWVKRFGE